MSEEQAKYSTQTKNFIILGMGYISKKHLEAIKAVGGKLLAFYEPEHENLGFIQDYFDYDIPYFKDRDRLDRHVYKLQKEGVQIDYCSVLSPNCYHEPQARWAIRSGINVICEKPICTSLHNFDSLIEIEKEFDKKVYPILQLRHHPISERMKEKCSVGYHKVNINYSTYRTSWYFGTWKNREDMSGGLIFNIGVHLVDHSSFLFGKYEGFNVTEKNEKVVSGSIDFERAHVNFRLSIQAGEARNRVFNIDGEVLSFDNGFTDLHTEVYRRIIENDNPVPLSEARQAIQICEDIRNAKK